MVETKHSPAPFTIRDLSNTVNACYQLVTSDGQVVANIPAYTIGQRGKANADLLKASPELLALALHVIAMADDTYLTGHPEWEAITKEARAAIATGDA
jgi:hypothetical protein